MHSHHASFVHGPPIITAVTQDHGDGQKSRHTPKITVFAVIVTPWFCCSPNYNTPLMRWKQTK